MFEIGRLSLNNKQFFIHHQKNFKKCYCLSNSIKDDLFIQTKKEFGSDLYIIYDNEKKIITETLGKVSNESDDKNIYYHLYTLNWLSDKKYSSLFDSFSFLYDSSFQRSQFNEIVYTIDPPDSIDLDDGFSIQQNNLYIHIADPSSYFQLKHHETILNELNQRLSTCYINKIRHLFPDVFLKQTTFLNNEYKEKRSLSLCISFNDKDEIINYQFINLSLLNIVNYTYNNFFSSNSFLTIKIEKLMTILINTYQFKIEKSNDLAHDWIQTLMITFNYLFSDFFIQNKINFIGRSQKPSNTLSNSFPNYVLPFLNYKAEYEWMNNNNHNIHFQLNLSHYAHASSPLRRYIDFLNHLLFYHQNIPSIDLNAINLKLKKYKTYSSAYDIITILSINNEFNAYILDLDEKFITLVIFNSHVKKFLKTIKPLNINNLKINQEIKVKVYYNELELKGIEIPLRIIII